MAGQRLGLAELQQRIKNNDISGVYVFYGDEEYTKTFYLKQLRLFCCGGLEYNRFVFEGDVSPAAIYDASRTVSFSDGVRLIEITGFSLTNALRSAASYAKALSELPKDSAVVFIYRAGEIETPPPFEKYGEKSNELFDFLNESAVIINFAPETGQRLISWVKKHFDAHSVPTEQSLPEYLVEYCGSDMYTLVSEINKLCAYYGGTPLTSDDIDKVCVPNPTFRLFDLVNCLAGGDGAKLKKIFDGLIAAKTRPELILGTIASHFVDLLIFKTALIEENSGAGGMAIKTIKSKLGLGDYQSRRLYQNASVVSLDFIKNSLEECGRADMTIKTRYGDEYMALELMLYRILSYAKQAKP